MCLAGTGLQLHFFTPFLSPSYLCSVSCSGGSSDDIVYTEKKLQNMLVKLC